MATQTSPASNELEALRSENAALKKQHDQISETERMIRAKIAAGLTREQAESVLRDQAAFAAKMSELNKEIAHQREQRAEQNAKNPN